MKKILNNLIKENPTFSLMIGLCPVLAVTTKVENAYIMGLCVLVVLLFSNFIISIIKKLVPENVKIPVFIIIVGTFVTILELLLSKFISPLYEILGIYLPLIVVNCIVLGRAMTVASKETIIKSIKDALIVGISFTLSITLVALIREVLGNNTITLMDSISSLTGYRAIYKIFPNNNILPINLFNNSAGAFLVLGILMGIFNYFKDRKGKKNESN